MKDAENCVEGDTDGYLVPHQCRQATRAKGRINALIDWGMGCFMAPTLMLRDEWEEGFVVFRDGAGWCVYPRKWGSDQLHYATLMDLCDDIIDDAKKAPHLYMVWAHSYFQTLLFFASMEAGRPYQPGDYGFLDIHRGEQGEQHTDSVSR